MYALEGLDHCGTAPVGLYGDMLIDNHEIKYSRSLTEKETPPYHNLKLDRLSERDKVLISLWQWSMDIITFDSHSFYYQLLQSLPHCINFGYLQVKVLFFCCKSH